MTTSNERVVKALRTLRKGDGLTLSSLAMLPNVAETFGTNDYRAIRRAIYATIAAEHDDKCVAALANALGIDTPSGLNLMERRTRYIKHHQMSMRTLTNYEEFGAILVGQMLPTPIAETSESDVARDLALVEDVIQRSIRRGGLTDLDQATAVEALRRLHEAGDDEVTAREVDRVFNLLWQALHALGEETKAAGGPVADVPASEESRDRDGSERLADA